MTKNSKFLKMTRKHGETHKHTENNTIPSVYIPVRFQTDKRMIGHIWLGTRKHTKDAS